MMRTPYGAVTCTTMLPFQLRRGLPHPSPFAFYTFKSPNGVGCLRPQKTASGMPADACGCLRSTKRQGYGMPADACVCLRSTKH